MFSFRGHSSGGDGRLGKILRIFLRFLQIVFAITVAGLYGTDIDSERKVDEYDKSKWVSILILIVLGTLIYMPWIILLTGFHCF